MNKFFLAAISLALAQVSAYGQTSIATGEALPLYYDVRSGNVAIDTTNVNGGVLTSYAFELPRDGYRNEEAEQLFLSYNYEAMTPFMDGFLTAASPKKLYESNFAGVPPGVYDIGNVLPANLDEAEFAKYFGPTGPPGSHAPYSYRAMGVPGSQTYHPFTPIYAPSPFPALNSGGGVIDPGERKWAVEGSLWYDPGRGGLTLDTTGPNGGAIWSYLLEFSNALIEPDAVQLATDGLLAHVDSSSITEIGSNGIQEGIYPLGDILPSGLSLNDLSDVVSRAAFVGEPGHGIESLNIDASGISFALALASEMPLYGDANLDGIVDATDLNILGQNWLLENVSGWSEGDFNGDDRVDQIDLNVLGANWLAETSSAAAAVPEPSTLIMYTAFLAAFFLRNRLRS